MLQIFYIKHISNNRNQQKQQPEVFYKAGRCSLKFFKIYRKTPVPESPFLNKVADLYR